MFFNGGEFWGRDPKYGLEQSLESLQLKKLGLMSHVEAVFFDMENGNQKTIALAKKYPKRFVPMAVINPLHYEASTNYLQQLKRKGFKGFSLFSHYQQWKLNQYAVHALASEFSGIGLPVQIGVASIEELAFAVEAFKNVSVPVLIRWLRGGGYNAIADEIAIAKDCPNFFFDVGNLTSLNSVRYLAESIGSDRLFIATNSPLVYDLSGRLLVEYGGLSSADYEQITWKTLADIFKIQKKWFPACDGMMSKGEEATIAEHITRPKIDPHWHSEGWDVIEPGKDYRSFKKAWDDCHYEAVIVSSVLALNYDMSAGNRSVATLIKKDPRAYGYIVIDPTRTDDSLAEIKKYAKNPRFVGIKTIQDYYRTGLDDPRYAKILEAAEHYHFPVLAHKAGLAVAAARYPNVSFIAGHCTYENFSEFIPLSNVTLDVTGSYAHRGETNLAAMMNAVGSTRMVYSSDSPTIAPYWAIGKIVGSSFDEKTLQALYHDNAARIFTRLPKTS